MLWRRDFEHADVKKCTQARVEIWIGPDSYELGITDDVGIAGVEQIDSIADSYRIIVVHIRQGHVIFYNSQQLLSLTCVSASSFVAYPL
jgi:hypothetical protein